MISLKGKMNPNYKISWKGKIFLCYFKIYIVEGYESRIISRGEVLCYNRAKINSFIL